MYRKLITNIVISVFNRACSRQRCKTEKNIINYLYFRHKIKYIH